MLRSEASTPVTEKPSRAIGSASRPPPQPMSRRRKPVNGRRSDGSRPNRCSACSRMKPSRTGLNLCSGANFPFGSHHSAAMRENFSTWAGSTEEVIVIAPLIPVIPDGLKGDPGPRAIRAALGPGSPLRFGRDDAADRGCIAAVVRRR
jgi:hypothetical protein